MQKQFHPRNKHNSGYDFNALCTANPALKPYLVNKKDGNESIDYANNNAVKQLNLALLKQFYGIDFWDIPEGFLCPPIPGRVDYLHYLADILKQSYGNKPAPGNKVKVLDVGTGASCIYPILGNRSYQWQFVASDIDPQSIKNATQILDKNTGLREAIDCRLQPNANHTFTDIIKTGECFDLTVCNPPFHESLEQGQQGSLQKWQNLNKTGNSQNSAKSKEAVKLKEAVRLNFGGQKAELWCKGGELRFVSNMIKESRRFKSQVLWFSCLVSKKDNLKALKFALKKVNAEQVQVVKMHQGNKITRFLAWSFFNAEQQLKWCNNRFAKHQKH